MQVTARKINLFLFVKLPSAFICGVRVDEINEASCKTAVRHRWINQNPFNSIYFAVQAMAAELSTGALLVLKIKQSKQNISMLVTATKSVFTKKAVGKISFLCQDGTVISDAIS